MADKDDDLQEQVENMAERLGLSGRERSQYIHEHMTRGGYKAVPQYVRGEDNDDDESSAFFSGGSRRRSRDDDDDDDRPSRRRRSQSRSSRRDDDWYRGE